MNAKVSRLRKYFVYILPERKYWLKMQVVHSLKYFLNFIVKSGKKTNGIPKGKGLPLLMSFLSPITLLINIFMILRNIYYFFINSSIFKFLGNTLAKCSLRNSSWKETPLRKDGFRPNWLNSAFKECLTDIVIISQLITKAEVLLK